MAATGMKRETFGMVLRRRAGVIITLSVILALLLGGSVALTAVNAAKTTIYPDASPSELTLEARKNSGAGDKVAILTETAQVGDDYFANALFCGDSLSDGIRIYDVFEGYRTCTKVGLSPTAATTDAFYELEDGTKLTMVEAIEYNQPSVIYVMLGTNGLNWLDIDSLIAGYGEFIDAVRARMPALSIVLESIPPTTRSTAESRPSYAPDNIRAYNSALLDLAERKGCYYLDVYSAVVDSEGYLPDDIAAADGIHFQPSGYAVWKQYLQTHVIQDTAAFSIGADGRMVFHAGSESVSEANDTEAQTEQTSQGDAASEGDAQQPAE